MPKAIESPTTRRALLAGAMSAIPAAALASVPALAAGADPIFAAIERHKAAEAHLDRVCSAEIEDEDEFMKAHAVADALAWALIDTPPTSVAGAAALLRYAFAFVEHGREWPNIESEPCVGCNQDYERWPAHLHRNLADTLERLAVAS